MAAFNIADLPTGTDRQITTYEELVVWASQGLLAANPTRKKVLEAGKEGVNIVQSYTGADADNAYQYFNFVAIPLDPAKTGLSLAEWKRVLPISTTDVPASFKG